MAPRRIVTFNWVTADGYFAAANGNLDWIVPDEEQAKTAAKDIVKFDTVLFGRRTYQTFEGFWRHAVIDDVGTVEDTHHPGRRSAEHGAIAIALKQDREARVFEDPEGPHLEQLPRAPRI
jgi:dihydrofolate reductase